MPDERTYLLRNEIARLIGDDPKLVRAYEELQRAALENLPELIEDAELSLESLDARVDVVEDALTDGATTLQDEGVSDDVFHTINFEGAGVSAEIDPAGVAKVMIPGAAGGGYEAGPPTPPTTADLATWDNQGTSTVSDGTGAMVLKPQVDALPHGRIKAAPATPWTVYCRVETNTLSSNTVGTAYNSAAGLIVKDTGGDNERVTFAVGLEHNASGGDDTKLYYAAIQRWTGASPPVFSSTPVIKYAQQPWKWLKVDNDGTTLTLSVGFDGKNWVTVGTETLAAFIDGAASFGVYAFGATATEVFSAFTYFSTTAPT